MERRHLLSCLSPAPRVGKPQPGGGRPPSRNGALATGGCCHSPELGETNLPTLLPELLPSQLGEKNGQTPRGSTGQGREGPRGARAAVGAGPDHSWHQDRVQTTRGQVGCPPPRPQPGRLPPPQLTRTPSSSSVWAPPLSPWALPGAAPCRPCHPAQPGGLQGIPATVWWALASVPQPT